MIKRKVCCLLLVAASLSGCLNPKATAGAGFGAGFGGIGGALIGSYLFPGKAWITMGAGAILGAVFGSAIGAKLDEKDKQLMAMDMQRSLEYAPTGQAYGWQNPDKRHSGHTTAGVPYMNGEGNFCRPFYTKINIDGKEEDVKGTACRKSDSAYWEIQQKTASA